MLHSCLKSVDTVWINSNKLDNLEQMIKDLKSLPGLRYLSAMKNPCVPDCFSQGKDLRDHARYRCGRDTRGPSRGHHVHPRWVCVFP